MLEVDSIKIKLHFAKNLNWAGLYTSFEHMEERRVTDYKWETGPSCKYCSCHQNPLSY